MTLRRTTGASACSYRGRRCVLGSLILTIVVNVVLVDRLSPGVQLSCVYSPVEWLIVPWQSTGRFPPLPALS